MSIDTGRERIDAKRRRRSRVVRLTPGATPGQAQERSIDSSPQKSVDPGAPRKKGISRHPQEQAGAPRGAPGFPVQLGRLKYYGLALLFVGGAAVLRWALAGVLNPTPTLVFYLAWVGAAAFGGLGPGLLATVASWLCVELLFPYTPGDIGFSNPASMGRLLVFLAGGLVVSVVGEAMRQSRIRERQQGRELANANAALGESEEKYRFLVENAKDVTWTMDLQGNWTFISGNVEQVAGYRVDEIMGKTLWDFLAPECHDLVREKLARRMGGEDLPPYEVLMVGKDGRRMPFEVHAVAIVDDGGNLVGVQGVSRDITERKRAEEALQFTQFAVEHTADAAFWMTEDARLFYVNEAACQALGYSREELLEMTVYDIDPAFTENMWVESWSKLKAQKSIILETVHRARDGRVYPVEIRANYVEFGGRAYDCAFARDITERKRAQEALVESRQKYRGLVEKINDWVWEIDADGVYTYSSPRALELLGYAPEEIVGKTPFDLMPPAEAQRVWDAFRPIWLERKPLELLENTLVRKDGRLVTVETSGMPVFAEDGSFLGYTGIDRDVTARQQAEEALRASQSMLQSVMDNVPQAIFWKDRQSTYLGCNHVFAKAAGLGSAGEIVGKTDYDLPWSPEQTASFREHDRQIMENDTPQYHLIEQQREANGKLLWVETNKVPLHDAQGCVVGILGTYADITERKHAEEALREWNTTLESKVARRTRELEHRARQLQKLTLELTEAEERERKRLAEILHDDLQQVLAAAKFQVGLLDARVRNNPESREIAQQARDLLVDAIGKSRSLSHELRSPAVSRSDLGEVFEWLAEQMQKKYEFTVHLEMGEPIELASEPLRVLLYKVAQELLFNAIKHAGVREAKLRLRRRRGRLRLSVSDKGRGFNPAEPGCDLGFGLLSIRERIEYLGGRMKIRSVVGKGSTFLITVPDPDAGAAAVTPTSATADGASTGTNQF